MWSWKSVVFLAVVWTSSEAGENAAPPGVKPPPAPMERQQQRPKYNSPHIPTTYVPSVPQALDAAGETPKAEESSKVVVSKYARQTPPHLESYPHFDYGQGPSGGGEAVFDPATFIGGGGGGGYPPQAHHAKAHHTQADAAAMYNSVSQNYPGLGVPNQGGGKYPHADFSSGGGGYSSHFGAGHDLNSGSSSSGSDYGYYGVKPLIRSLGALLPLGLLLAALPPNVINLTVRKKRSVSTADGNSPHLVYTNPVLEMIEAHGLDSLESAACQRRVLCELAILGHKPEGNSVQKFLWNVANMVPDILSATMGLQDTFAAVRKETCQQFRCPQAKNMKKRFNKH